jgi:hypothetical protein
MTTRRHILAAAASLLAALAFAQQMVRIPREWVPPDGEVAPGLASA